MNLVTKLTQDEVSLGNEVNLVTKLTQDEVNLVMSEIRNEWT